MENIAIHKDASKQKHFIRDKYTYLNGDLMCRIEAYEIINKE